MIVNKLLSLSLMAHVPAVVLPGGSLQVLGPPADKFIASLQDKIHLQAQHADAFQKRWGGLNAARVSFVCIMCLHAVGYRTLLLVYSVYPRLRVANSRSIVGSPGRGL
jgi:hypothetical protein